MHLSYEVSKNTKYKILSVTEGIVYVSVYIWSWLTSLCLQMKTAEKRERSAFQSVTSPSSHSIDFMSIQICDVKWPVFFHEGQVADSWELFASSVSLCFNRLHLNDQFSITHSQHPLVHYRVPLGPQLMIFIMDSSMDFSDLV